MSAISFCTRYDEPCSQVSWERKCEDCPHQRPSSLPPVAGEPVAVPLREIVRRFIEYHTTHTEMSFEVIQDDAKFTEFMGAIKAKIKVLVADAIGALAAAPLTASKGEGVQSDDGALGENSGSVLSDPSSPSEGATTRMLKLVELWECRDLAHSNLSGEYEQAIQHKFILVNKLPPPEGVTIAQLEASFPPPKPEAPFRTGDAGRDRPTAVRVPPASSTAAGATSSNSPIPESAGVREALSDEEIDAIASECDMDKVWYENEPQRFWRDFARAVLATQGATP